MRTKSAPRDVQLHVHALDQLAQQRVPVGRAGAQAALPQAAGVGTLKCSVVRAWRRRTPQGGATKPAGADRAGGDRRRGVR